MPFSSQTAQGSSRDGIMHGWGSTLKLSPSRLWASEKNE